MFPVLWPDLSGLLMGDIRVEGGGGDTAVRGGAPHLGSMSPAHPYTNCTGRCPVKAGKITQKKSIYSPQGITVKLVHLP